MCWSQVSEFSLSQRHTDGSLSKRVRLSQSFWGVLPFHSPPDVWHNNKPTTNRKQTTMWRTLRTNGWRVYTAIWPKRVCSVKFTRCWCIFGRWCQRERDVVDRFKIDLDTVSTVDVAKTCNLISFSWNFPAEPNAGNNVDCGLFNLLLRTV